MIIGITGLIGSGKDTIADYEVRNELLAESNDSFRIGALDAVSFAR
jgi:adenylylsulfate kinase-like enzyme